MRSLLATAAICGLTASAAATTTHSAVITFDNGWEGWNGTQGPGGSSFIEPTGGNPGAHARTIFNNFGIEWWTQTNTDFVGDFTKYDTVTISIDVKVEGIWFFGAPVSRNLILDLRSFSQGQGGYPWSSVWYNMTEMQAGMDWATYSVTFDPNSTVMPGGWGGTGDEDPDTYEPKLPDNLTFADILANVEEMTFTTYEPGHFYGFTDFDIRIDNIRIEATILPAPGAALALLGLFGAVRRRKRRNVETSKMAVGESMPAAAGLSVVGWSREIGFGERELRRCDGCCTDLSTFRSLATGESAAADFDVSTFHCLTPTSLLALRTGGRSAGHALPPVAQQREQVRDIYSTVAVEIGLA